MRPDPTILAFDSSAAHCAAALLLGGEIVAAQHEEMVKGQAERLFPMLEEALAEGGLGWSALDGIGVGTGPGNFTGIRIAVSAARGLALSLGIPAVGVNLFDALAFGTEGVVIASVPAPRGEVYARVLHHTGANPVIGNAATVPLDAPARSEPTCIGADADVLADRFSGSVVQPAFPMAEAIARVVLARKDNVTTKRPTPLYVRPADAAPPSDPPPVILT